MKKLYIISVVAVVLELSLRLIYPNMLSEYGEKKSFPYEFDRLLGWKGSANKSSEVTYNRKINVKHNSLGFRDIEHFDNSKPKILFLGDSFLYGFDLEEKETFIEILRKKLPNYELYNCGIAGYSTDQEFLLLNYLIKAEEMKFDTLFLLFTENDREGNSCNQNNLGDQKPFFTSSDGKNLCRRNVPVPETTRSFLKKHRFFKDSLIAIILLKKYYRYKYPKINVSDPTHAILSNIQKTCLKNNINFCIGLQKQDLNIINFCKEQQIRYLNLETPAEMRTAEHWNKNESIIVADRISANFN